MPKNKANFYLKAVSELFLNGFTKLTKFCPYIVNPFTVSIHPNSKKRLIVDLRHLNAFLDPPKFKMDDFKMALPALKFGNFMFVFDLEKGYYLLTCTLVCRGCLASACSLK